MRSRQYAKEKVTQICGYKAVITLPLSSSRLASVANVVTALPRCTTNSSLCGLALLLSGVEHAERPVPGRPRPQADGERGTGELSVFLIHQGLFSNKLKHYYSYI